MMHGKGKYKGSMPKMNKGKAPKRKTAPMKRKPTKRK